MADKVEERNNMSPTPALELSTGAEGEGMPTTEGNREETPQLPFCTALKQVIDSSDFDKFEEIAFKIERWCHDRVSSAAEPSRNAFLVELENCCVCIDSEPDMGFVRGSPSSFELKLRLVNEYENQLRFQDAMKICNDIIAHPSGTEHLQFYKARAWARLADVYTQLRQVHQAKVAYGKFFELMLSLPDSSSWIENVRRYSFLSHEYFRDGNVPESKKFAARTLQYLEGREEHQDFVNHHKIRLITLLGCASESSNHLYDALEYHSKAFKISRDCGDNDTRCSTHYHLGDIQARLGLYSEAITTLKQGLVFGEKAQNVNLQSSFHQLLVEVYAQLTSGDMTPGNFILSRERADEELQKHWKAFTKLTQRSAEPMNLKRVEEELKFCKKEGDLAGEFRANLFICMKSVDPESPNRDVNRARQTFEACQKCLKEWKLSQNCNVASPAADENMRLQLAWCALVLGELEEAERILRLLLRSHEEVLNNIFNTAGDASDGMVLELQESNKTAFMAMMKVQLELVRRDKQLHTVGANSTSNPNLNPKILNTLKALMWSERSRARVATFRIAPGFLDLVKSLKPGDERELQMLRFPDVHNLPSDNPEYLLESLALNNDPLLEGPLKAIKGTYDHILFSIDDSYALNFILNAVRDSKMVFVEYFILDAQRLLIFVLKRKLSYEEARRKGLDVSHTMSIGCSVVDIHSKIKESTRQEALTETSRLSQMTTSGSSSDPVSIMNANRFYTNVIITGLVAKTHSLMIGIHQKLKQPRSRGEPEPYVKDEEDKVIELYKELYSLLIKPIEEYLEGLTSEHTVVFIPPEDMGLIPFAALVDGKNVPFDEKFAVAAAPSIFSVRLCEEQYKKKTFSGGELLVGKKDGYPVNGKWPPLPQAHDEVKAVQKFCSTSADCVTDELLGAELASVNMKCIVEQRMRTASWLHFSVHGQISQQFPRGSLLLGCDDSSRLTGDEIKQAGPLEARAAVLSACQSALGSIRGEGILGFARSFMVAGVPITILSMWEVSEEFCIDFMERLYSKLREGFDVARAMQQVRQDMRKVTKDVSLPGRKFTRKVTKWHVYDLAAFACFGYPGVKFVAEKGKDIAPPWRDLLQDDPRYKLKTGKGQRGSSASTS